MTFPVVFHRWFSGFCMATVSPVCNGERLWLCLLYLSTILVFRWWRSSSRRCAPASPSVGAYRRSASVQGLLPANTMRHPSGQHTGAFSVGHVQTFYNNRKSMPSLLQSGARQVTLLMSNVVTLFFLLSSL